MDERTKVVFQINQNNKLYSLTTSLSKDKINLVCKDETNNQIYESSFTLPELLRISKYFSPNYTLEQILLYLNGIIEKQRVRINQGPEFASIDLHLINNDMISLPLLKIFDIKQIVNNPFLKYNKKTGSNQFVIKPKPNTKIVESLNDFTKNSNDIQIIQKQKQINKIKAIPGSALTGNAFLKEDNSEDLDEIKLTNLENENKILKAGQEELKNVNKKLLQEIAKLKEQNTILKNENDKFKQQLLLYKNENTNLKKKIEKYKTDLDTVENQNDPNEKVRLYKKIEDLTEKINRYPFILEKDEEMLSIIFMSVSQKVNYSIICKNTDTIHSLEPELYKEYPEFSETENYFLCKGTVINKFKKFNELNINNGNIIIINQKED